MIPLLVAKNLFKDAKKQSLSFLRKAYLIPLVIVETLGNFVVISMWFVYVLSDLRV